MAFRSARASRKTVSEPRTNSPACRCSGVPSSVTSRRVTSMVCGMPSSGSSAYPGGIDSQTGAACRSAGPGSVVAATGDSAPRRGDRLLAGADGLVDEVEHVRGRALDVLRARFEQPEPFQGVADLRDLRDLVHDEAWVVRHAAADVDDRREAAGALGEQLAAGLDR